MADVPQQQKLTVQPLSVGTFLDDTVEILEFLGEGGMSAIYRGHHRAMQRDVAVKVLKGALVDQKALTRFHREARALTSFEHENLPRVFSFGCIEGQRPYFVMELVRGRSLSEIIAKEGTLDELRAAKIFVQICDALSEVHSKGIIHRDLKPSNVMLVGENDQVKVIDFGIAKCVEEIGIQGQKITATAAVLGSPAYMSPEQCTGAPLDARTDIYSLGSLMYEALCGRTPFEGESPFAVIHKHLTEQPMPDERLKNRAGRIALWCMSKSPDDRPQTAADVRNALLDPKAVIGKASVKTLQPNLRAGALAFMIIFLLFAGSFWVFTRSQQSASQPVDTRAVNELIRQGMQILPGLEGYPDNDPAYDKVIDAFKTANKLCDTPMPSVHSEELYGESGINLIAAYKQKGDYPSALRCAKELIAHVEKSKFNSRDIRNCYLGALYHAAEYYSDPCEQDASTLRNGAASNYESAADFSSRMDRYKERASDSKIWSDLVRQRSRIDTLRAGQLNIKRYTPATAKTELSALTNELLAARTDRAKLSNCIQSCNRLIALVGEQEPVTGTTAILITALNIEAACFYGIGQDQEAAKILRKSLRLCDQAHSGHQMIQQCEAQAALILTRCYLRGPNFHDNPKTFGPLALDLCKRLARFKDSRDRSCKADYEESLSLRKEAEDALR
jgi:serine/threonine protein kinase